MKITHVILLAVCAVIASVTHAADESAKLIELDKRWGEATTPDAVAPLLSRNFISLNADGVTGRTALLEAMAADDSDPAPYVSGDYTVEFLNARTAVMVHSVGTGADTQWSMHVWQKKKNGPWKVAATASVASGD